ncbi:probable peroxidase 61 [Beta vulgaris subsp. vulgaris]|uniref:probable peroxidase 61 n=1 Tax=Beta vulgaris subsp. vulgaris TaxID=3555 RepID=UPI0020371049|nr:probable peroxidase 61 [Beta vulgaris subsp. vulgaris]
MEGAKQVVFLPLVALLALVIAPMIVDGAVPRYTYTRQYYKKTNTCANAEAFVKHQVKKFWEQDHSVTPKLLRLLYSDCMVTGCDASILLDGADSERMAKQNIGLGAFIVIDKIKIVLDSYCPGVVSCADILQLATRDAVSLAGGPSYPVLTGRRDGLSSKASSVDLPSPYISLNEGLEYFEARGLNIQDYTVLLGAHSMGRARCRYIRDRLYNFKGTGKADPTLDTSKLEELRKQCPQTYKSGEHEKLVYLNNDSNKFSSSYYNDVLANKAVLKIDQDLLYGNETQQLSEQFSFPDEGLQDYKKAFALSMYRLSNYNVLTGQQGEIRRNCHFTNSHYA